LNIASSTKTSKLKLKSHSAIEMSIWTRTKAGAERDF